MAGKILGPILSELLDDLPTKKSLVALPLPEPKRRLVDALAVKSRSAFDIPEPPEKKKVYVDSLVKTDYNSNAFRIVENKKVLSIFDNSGEEIFQIDKGV